MSRDNLKTVHICNSLGQHVETVQLRINQRQFNAGTRFIGLRNKVSLAKVRLEFVRETDSGEIIAKKVK